jgi:hypothetical protein
LSDLVLIPLPGLGTLELPRSVFDQYLRMPEALSVVAAQSAAVSNAKLLSAEAMEAATGVPASWFATQARERRIPFRKLGRYVRFDFDEVMTSDALKRRAIPPGQMHCTGSLDRKGPTSV